MRTPASVLADLLRSDAGRPRITCYDDSPGPTQGERIELSARVLSNWVSKAANALQEEWDVEPGSVVRLALPAHWRSLYWAFAVWSVGGCVVVDVGGADVTITDDAEVSATAGPPGALVTLAGLARSASVPVPQGVMDEAKELSTYADQFSPWAEPRPADHALRAGGELTAYDSLVANVTVPQANWTEGVRVHTTSADLADLLVTALRAWSLDGSVVLSRGGDPAALVSRIASEGVTLAL